MELWVQSSTQNYKLTEKIAIQTASVRNFSFNTGVFPVLVITINAVRDCHYFHPNKHI